jgi:predicted amidophosphoribosyltransferase
MNNRLIKKISDFVAKIIDSLANLLIPKEEKVKYLEALGPDGLFEKIPRSENFDFETDKIKAIFNYKTALCRQAIWEIKYRANKKLIQDFSLLLYEYILDELSDLETFSNFKNIILLPIPSSPARTREKGFNQCILIFQELIKIDQERKGQTFTMVKDFLIKKNDTMHQARVSNRKMRLKNLINTFSINPEQATGLLSERLVRVKCRELSGGLLTDYSFIIIDDVITTGATMNEAFRALKSAGIPPRKIRGYALAH